MPKCILLSLQIDAIANSYRNLVLALFNWSLISPFILIQAKLRSALSRLGGTDAIVMQGIVGEELAQGPYVAARERFEPVSLRT